MKEFINKSEKELKTLLAQKREALRTFRFAGSGSNMRNVKEGKNLRKEIAQMLTVLNNKSKVSK